MDGILLCSRYAFGPNRLHYCGPDASREISAYIENQASDSGLKNLLKEFRTMYPYLQLIARANGIPDPFDLKVVEAYWIGNDLLQNVEAKNFYQHLLEEQEIKTKIGPKSFEALSEKIKHGALPHHSFHVFNIWRRTGHDDSEHTLTSLDQCRISWGLVKKVDGPLILLETEPVVYQNGKLALGVPILKKIIRRLEVDIDIEQIKPGDTVTLHWNVPCQVITPAQAQILKKYTLWSLDFANQTL